MTSIKRSIITLYSGMLDIDSHRVRIVLAEKGVAVDIIEADHQNPSEHLLEMNHYTGVPTLIDRDLVLYEPRVITEYLDERFPHPPLLPVYPIARAKCRLMIHRIERDWLIHVPIIEKGKKQTADKARKAIREILIGVAPLFIEMPYFLSEDFSLIDCCIAPLLWRLSSLGIELPRQAKPVLDYAKRVFDRNSFQESLTDLEIELRE